MVEFKLPDVGEGMEEAEVIRWLVKPGDKVRVDQVMVEIQTDKALVEIPSPVAGIVADIRVKEGEIAQVGTVLVAFDTQNNTVSTATPARTENKASLPDGNASAASNSKPKEAVFSAQSLEANLSQAQRVRAAPAVRKKAVELDVDLSSVKPSSPDGRVLMQDVLNYEQQKHQVGKTNGSSKLPQQFNTTNFEMKQSVTAAGQTPNVIDNETSGSKISNGSTEQWQTFPASGKVENLPSEGNALQEIRKPLVGLRRRIAERMEQSWRTIPHVTTFDDVDAFELVALRQRLQPAAEQKGLHLTYLPFIIKAVVQALKQHPIVNSSLDEQTHEIVLKQNYHIGLATATPDGLLVPVLRHADKLNMLQLTSEINRLTEGARNRSLKAAELSGSTFTITNFGSFGGQRGTPIINPPEVAILGVGQLKDQVVARQNQVVIRPILPLSLSFDHRLIDGADSGAFTRTLTELLENPYLQLLEMI